MKFLILIISFLMPLNNTLLAKSITDSYLVQNIELKETKKLDLLYKEATCNYLGYFLSFISSGSEV